MEEAERLCDRVGIIDHGKLIAEGTRADLVSMLGVLAAYAVVLLALASWRLRLVLAAHSPS